MKLLRHIVILPLLIFSTLVTSVDICCEIQKIPNLVAHFAEHKAMDGDSVFDFVVEDYIDLGSDSKHHDENSHEDLPFHGNHSCFHGSIYFSQASNLIVIVSDLYRIEARTFYSFLFTSPVLGDLFQPPQA